MKKRLPVNELQFGMYIADLDRPWTDTPFMFQGFVLSSQRQLEALKQYCTTVYVDTERTERVAAPAGVGNTVYAEKVSVEQEAGPARVAYSSSRTLMRDVLSTVKIGRTLDAGRI